jgi:hypothetical protein
MASIGKRQSRLYRMFASFTVMTLLTVPMLAGCTTATHYEWVPAPLSTHAQMRSVKDTGDTTIDVSNWAISFVTLWKMG